MSKLFQTSSQPNFPPPKNPRYTFNFPNDNDDKYCTKCHHPISRTANFCQWCGKKQLPVLVAEAMKKYLEDEVKEDKVKE